VGKNGHGKSSIALILEEVLYNKNSKGIKKADILNRYIKDNWYSIELEFEKNSESYKIETRRSSTQTVKFSKNSQDISAHTATATYKMIESVIGIDHKTFAQIVYQSNANSLEFLTSADTARKKFLIELLNLGTYTRTGEEFKKLYHELEVLASGAESKVKTIETWIQKYQNQNLDEKFTELVPQLDESLIVQLDRTQQDLLTIAQQNKRINQNNTYKELQSKLKVFPKVDKPEDNSSELVAKKAEYTKAIQDANKFIKKLQGLGHSCPTCEQPINQTKTQELLDEQRSIVTTSTEFLNSVQASIDTLNTAISTWQQAVKSQEEWEKYYQLIDTELPTELLNQEDLKSQVLDLEKEITKQRKAIQEAEKHNSLVIDHNNRVKLIKSQLEEMNQELNTWQTNLKDLQTRLNTVGILVKTFSTTGLVAYKIENLVKDLEQIANEYLEELSSGRFQLTFEISGNDKLNVIIVDNGRNIDIQALSGGERARVNVAALLAIRRLMQSLSQNRVNLLVLDETIETLDVEGKEKLVEVLLKEVDLNTLLVSHGFTHPLVEKVQVVKRKNISTVED
jgi:DNA repair exonuclease SbcCD ATPase subunit